MQVFCIDVGQVGDPTRQGKKKPAPVLPARALAGQYSPGRRKVVTLRSPSVMTQRVLSP